MSFVFTSPEISRVFPLSLQLQEPDSDLGFFFSSLCIFVHLQDNFSWVFCLSFSSMPEPPPYSSILTLFLLFSLFLITRAANRCSSLTADISRSPCPPFTSSPSFPFSFSPGCGHPSFQIECASPHSLISINNLSFAIIRFQPYSSSLTLSPIAATTPTDCSSLHFLSLANHSINLSGTPFRVSDASCSRFSVLRPCSPPNLPNCSHCPWDCKLIKNPAQLLRGCGSMRSPLSEQGCQDDILGFLENFFSKWGIEVEWEESQDPYFSSCKTCEAKNGVCGFNSSDPSKHFICFLSKSSFSPTWISPRNSNRLAILCSIFALTCILLAVSVAIAIFRSKRLKSSASEEDPATLFLHRIRSASLLPPVFTYEELETATDRFDPKRKIGDGGFGSVYLGHLEDGRTVAVKYLHKHQHHAAAAAGMPFSTKSFCNEILILSSIDHPNLVKLHGYCSDPRGLLLVYDYVPNGTLADHLHGPKSMYRKGCLTWPVRLDIALQTALAVEYLHFCVVPAIVHRDITSSNIFVERDMRIKVGDFGLSRLLVVPETSSSSGFVWTGPQGTPGYLDPEYHRSFRLTEKSDVYSFGVVLLELISGQKAVDQSREKREMALADLAVSKIQMGMLRQVVDPVLAADPEAMKGVNAVAELAFRCVAADKDDRPDAREVVEELRRIRDGTRAGGESNGKASVSDVGEGM